MKETAEVGGAFDVEQPAGIESAFGDEGTANIGRTVGVGETVSVGGLVGISGTACTGTSVISWSSSTIGSATGMIIGSATNAATAYFESDKPLNWYLVGVAARPSADLTCRAKES